MMNKPEVPAVRDFAATITLKKILTEYFQALDTASLTRSSKIAWCTSVGPAELLRAMGFLVYFPENHGALLGATRQASECIPVANSIGFSPEICSYLTSDIGSYIRKSTPLTKAYGIRGIPRPDVLVYNTNQCRDVQDWFSYYGREWGVPVLGLHTHRGINEIKSYHLNDLSAQLQALVPTLESISGSKFDIDRLRYVLSLSKECSRLWREVLECAMHTPSPITFFDSVIQMAPAVVLRGLPEAITYYRLLLEELHGKIVTKVSAVTNERFRLYWEGMPVWGKLRRLSDVFLAQHTAVVASSYCNSWIFEDFDPSNPFESMSRAYTELFIVRDENFKEAYILNAAKQYKVNGIIFHDAKTCPNNSNNRYCMPQRIANTFGIPHLVLNGDLNDLRLFSEDQSITNIEAFIEQLELRN